MPKRELSHPHQVIDWLHEWAGRLAEPAEMILIGSAALLWHVARVGRDDPLPENSMDADPVTESDAIAELAYDALIGSEFEQTHGWHVNLMPRMVLDHLPAGWRDRAFAQTYRDKLKLIVPAVADLLAPKRMRNEARDREHEAFAAKLGLI
ncbi:MAG: hypothetical protein IAE77_13865 [Prosthecobacter sp.]|jgi:hypothetical protein|uniref:hypothetical protein n=1 Tax=Prosthecobacter sp. TaxID=1965333 RepID=UPI001A0E996D|nr:hypothetical protein [Prosthecobacter sp.]MBE2284538.1 hypothetical protein [Prosthecobacter sp.]